MKEKNKKAIHTSVSHMHLAGVVQSQKHPLFFSFPTFHQLPSPATHKACVPTDILVQALIMSYLGCYLVYLYLNYSKELSYFIYENVFLKWNPSAYI